MTSGNHTGEERFDVLASPRGRRRLGEILEELGVVGAADALLGRYEQDFGDDRRLGEILVAQGLASREQVDAALQIQHHANFTDREDAMVGPASAVAARATIADRRAELGSVESRRVVNPSIRRIRNVQSAVMFAVAVAGVGLIVWASGGHGSWYGAGALLWLCAKLIGSAVHRPVGSAAASGCRAAVVVSFYNEDPRAFLRCLDSINGQTRPADEIWVIDDGSADDSCYRIAQLVLRDACGAVLHRLDANAGKRHAQGLAFARTTCDIVVTVDSDTVLDRAAIAEGLRPFADPTVMAVAGSVRALNHRTNLLTRLIDLRYANAFLFERAAYSTLGSVVCCCGSLSFFRTDVIRRHLRDFLTQSFLGMPVQYGDDRRLTQYALTEGKVLLQDSAVAYTLVPERLDHFRRQQLRWNKSFFRESLWAIRRFGPKRWPFWISITELAIWIAFTATLLSALYVRPLLTGTFIPWYYPAFAVVLAYARNVRYFGRPGETVRGQIATFALAPLYTLLHVVLLTPLRLWALLTLRQTQWGTRTRVEVKASDETTS